MKLPLDAKISVISRIAKDFVDCVESESVPAELTYRTLYVDGGVEETQKARMAAFAELTPSPITKFAFDTRRVDQEGSRNPRKNLQYWHRSDQFIDEGDEKRLKTFAKLAKVLNKMKDRLGTSPEWFESYSRQLYDNVFRILRVKEADLDIFRPQISYLEQLVFARYRLSMENLEKYSEEKLEERLLSKDEELIGRSLYLKETQTEESELVSKSMSKEAPLQTGGLTQESIVNAIFGGQSLLKSGDKSVERTITITLRDNVIEKEAEEKDSDNE